MTSAGTPKVSAAYGYCSWHHAYVWGVRLIRATDQGSGSQVVTLWACGACRATHSLTPIADEP